MRTGSALGWDRVRKVAVLAACSISLSSALAGAETAAPLDAELSCDPAPRPGRVLCRVTFRAQGVRLVWADALIVGSPAEASPLRARVGPAEIREPSQGKLELALVANKALKGTLEVQARAAFCDAEDRCRAWSRRIATELVVEAP